MEKSLQKIFEEQKRKGEILLSNIKIEKQNLEKLLAATNDHWGEEDLVYRFYHDSFKVYRIQNLTDQIYEALKKISPHENKEIFNEYYKNIIKKSRLKSQEPLDNLRWEKNSLPLLEAFFHSKYFLEMAVKSGKRYAKNKRPPLRVYSGWAALLELYCIR
jgi:hypothetical protein